jgi:hypothetical protein
MKTTDITVSTQLAKVLKALDASYRKDNEVGQGALIERLTFVLKERQPILYVRDVSTYEDRPVKEKPAKPIKAEKVLTEQDKEKIGLLGEKSALEQMLRDTPKEDVLDRTSLLARLETVRERLATLAKK